MATKDYSADDIKVLSDREHVRLRTQIYLGNMEPTQYRIPLFKKTEFDMEVVTFIPAVYKAVGEIIDNSLDEFAQIDTKDKHLSIQANPLLGMYTISDNGRGVPIDKHETGPYTPQVVFGQLRSGRNFTDEKEEGVIGQNGVGSACVNYCSTQFKIDIVRGKKRYLQVFGDGGNSVSTPFIKRSSAKQGTKIEFQLDREVFSDITLPNILLENRAIEIALTNPGVTVEYNKKKYQYKNGFCGLIKKFSEDYYKFQYRDMEFYVIFDINQAQTEQVFTWVNSSLLFDGGICNTQFLNGFTARTIDHLAKEAKKNKCVVSRADILDSLLVIGNIKVSDPQYDAQSKTRLTGPSMRNNIDTMLSQQWASFTRTHKDWLQQVMHRAMREFHAKEDKDAIKKHQKNLSRKIDKLLDATGEDRRKCWLLVTEGDSASSQITEARQAEIHASLPLSGKLNNVYGTTVAQLLKMGKVADLLTAIGLVPGVKAIRSHLKYGKVVLATDADPDGSDIFTLLVNVFHTFWPELLDPNYPPFIFRLIAPNVCAVKGKKRIHFTTRAEFEKVKGRYKNYTIKYFKGLGSMSQVDWEMVLSGKTNTLIPITDDGKMGSVLKLLFSPDADRRKEWLQKKN